MITSLPLSKIGQTVMSKMQQQQPAHPEPLMTFPSAALYWFDVEKTILYIHVHARWGWPEFIAGSSRISAFIRQVQRPIYVIAHYEYDAPFTNDRRVYAILRDSFDPIPNQILFVRCGSCVMLDILTAQAATIYNLRSMLNRQIAVPTLADAVRSVAQHREGVYQRRG
jgi:hypothetical protein